ncbi:MAG: hypothetical protein Ta2A_09630 [Treponemataceae bacterium]|nr:MAG: hypothetical protein Ta2A_09630 [Treponemataceae bacterium]
MFFMELARVAGVMRYEELKNFAFSLCVFRAGGRTELAGNHTDHNFCKALAAAVQLVAVFSSMVITRRGIRRALFRRQALFVRARYSI